MIKEHIFVRLAARDVRVIHFDQKSGPDVHISGDIFDPACQEKLKDLAPKLIICANMVEHLPPHKLKEFPEILFHILSEGGYLFISAPRSYPYHADPIDNMYRPTSAELAGTFPHMTMVASDVIVASTYWEDLQTYSWSDYWRIARRLLKPFRKREKWKSTAHRFLWLFHRYEQSCLVLRKPVLTRPSPAT